MTPICRLVTSPAAQALCAARVHASKAVSSTRCILLSKCTVVRCNSSRTRGVSQFRFPYVLAAALLCQFRKPRRPRRPERNRASAQATSATTERFVSNAKPSVPLCQSRYGRVLTFRYCYPDTSQLSLLNLICVQFLAFLAHKTLPPCKFVAERNNFVSQVLPFTILNSTAGAC